MHSDQAALEPPSRWRAIRPHLVALFVTFHLACVVLYLIPTPPYINDRALNHPDVKEEIDRSVRLIRGLLGYQGSEQRLRQSIIDGIRTYSRLCGELRGWIGLYLEPVGSTQSWNMFGGTPPRHPRVMMVEVRPVAGAGFQPFQDGRWGTPTDYALHFRHRKAQELLSLGGRNAELQWYARYWARRWSQVHPEAPARAVRLYYAQLHTRTPAEVRAGRPARKEDRVTEFTWRNPAGETP